MIIDMHANITPYDPDYFARLSARGVPGNPEHCMVEPTLRRMDANGIDMSVVWWTGRTSEECRARNDFVAAQRDRYPDRFIPFATVDPKDPDSAVEEIDRAIDELGMAGIKLHPKVMEISLDDPRFVLVVRKVAERDVPFVTHVNTTRAQHLPTSTPETPPDPIDANVPSPFSKAEKLAPLVATYDSPRFQSAHMGGVLLSFLRESTISFQTAGASLATIQWAVSNIDPQRVVFGSDFPFFLVQDELKKIRELAIDDETREAILWRNAATRVLRPSVTATMPNS